jgi:5-methylcytosine-specific restriction endonuclease McrA
VRRSKPLARGGEMKRTAPLGGSGRLKSKPKPKLTKRERSASQVWHDIVVARGCEVCPRLGEACEGPIQGHHVCSRQVLRRRKLAHLTWCLENGMGVCERAHARHTNRKQPIERRLLRRDHERFAELHGLVDVLDRAYV